MGQPIALLCTLHPTSPEAKKRILSLLAASKPYYQTPTSKCTTWAYMNPSQTLGVPCTMVPPSESDNLVAGIEIYTDKDALSIQTESAMFKDFHSTVTREGLYAADEELVAWYPAGGYVSRGETARPFGGGVLVLMARHVCRPGRRDEFVRVMHEYAEWMKENEPGFLTYCMFTRKKAPDEVLVVERCTGEKAFRSHTSTPEFMAALRKAVRCIKSSRSQEWTELDNAFVGNVLGGVESVSTSKL